MLNDQKRYKAGCNGTIYGANKQIISHAKCRALPLYQAQLIIQMRVCVCVCGVVVQQIGWGEGSLDRVPYSFGYCGLTQTQTHTHTN